MKVPVVPLNIPNILSLYRLFSFPFILVFIFIGEMELFVFFICFNLITDAADGFIARHFNMMTEIGAKIDALADNGTYILALAGIFTFKWLDIQPYMISFSIFMALFLIADFVPVIRFREHGSNHTYSAKIGGYIKGSFLFVWFVWGFNEWFYYFMVITGYLSFIENIIISLILKEPRVNVKGLYWVLKENRKE